MSQIDELLANNEAYAEQFDKGDLPLPPGRKIAIVACMDARLSLYSLLGLTEGEAHVIRNAGGVITDDEIRSLAISQRLLGTEEIMLIHHTDCGMLTFPRRHFKAQIEEETGIKPAGPPRRSATSTRTSGSRSRASGRARSSQQGSRPRVRLRGRDGPPARSGLTVANLSFARGLAAGRSPH